MGRGRPRKVDGALAADTDKAISLYLPFVQTAWLAARDKGHTIRQLIREATGLPPPPGPIEGDSGKDAARLPPADLARLDDLVGQALAAGDRRASRSSILRALIYDAMHARLR